MGIKDLWAVKWFRIATITAAALILVSLFVNFRSCGRVDYWKGQADAAEGRVKALGYTIESLEKGRVVLEADHAKEVAELRGMVDSANTVAAAAQDQIDLAEGRIVDLEKELGLAGTIEEKYRIVLAQNTELRTVIALKDTQIAEKNRIIELKDAEIAVKDRAYAELKLDFGKAVDGWRAEKERADALERVNRALGVRVAGLKLQAAIGKVGGLGLLALGIYSIASK